MENGNKVFLNAMKKEKDVWEKKERDRIEKNIQDSDPQEIFTTEEYESLSFIANKLNISFDEFLNIDSREVIRINFESDFLDTLPDGFLYKGGAARSALERYLGIDEESTPRDIDIAYTGNQDEKLINELSLKYMPDDFENGYGAEDLDSDWKYFDTRDFTINEVLYNNGEITATKDAILDTYNRTIRLAQYEKKENWSEWNNSKFYNSRLEYLMEEVIYNEKDGIYFTVDEWGEKELISNETFLDLEQYKKEKEKFMNENPWIQYKLLAKAVRFIVERDDKNSSIDSYGSLDDYENIYKHIQRLGMSEFHIALHLDRILETKNRRLGEKYIEQMLYFDYKSYSPLPKDLLEDKAMLDNSVTHLNNILTNFEIKNYNQMVEEEKSGVDLYSEVKLSPAYEKYFEYGENYATKKKKD